MRQVRLRSAIKGEQNRVSKKSLRGGNQKLEGLELVRFLAAFAILIWHYKNFAYVGYVRVEFQVYQQPFYDALEIFYRYGYLAVHVFWCISGYIFFWKYEHSIAEGRIGSREFFILRFSRLYPLHFATLLAVAALQLGYRHAGGTFFVFPDNTMLRFFLQLFMADHWGLPDTLSFNAPFWSVSVEVLVYVLFFLLLRVFGSSMMINGLVIVLAGVSRMFVAHPVFDSLIFFYLGGITAIGGRIFISREARVFLSLAAATGLALAMGVVREFALYDRKGFEFFVVAPCTPLVLYLMSEWIHVDGRARAWIEAVGNMTYSSYLVHFPMQTGIALVYLWMGETIPMYSAYFFVSYLALVLILSFFIFRLFEAPAQQWIRRRCLPHRAG